MASLGGALARVVVPAALFVWSIAVRAVGVPALLEGADGAFLFGNDAYYHARRIWYTVVNFPEFLTRDAYIGFPHGAQPIWSPTFDWLSALVVRVAVGPADQAAMERLLVWIPPVLGALTVVVLYFVARRVFSARVAFASGFFLSLMPGHFWYSQAGFVDHHVAVALMTTWLLAATMNLLGQETATEIVPARTWRAALGLGLASGSAILIWPGCLIHVAVVELALIVHLLLSPASSPSPNSAINPAGWQAITRARLYALANAVALVLVFPLSWGNEWERWGSLSPLVLSHFQPLWFGAAALSFGALGEIWRRRSIPSSIVDRLLQAMIVGGVVAGLTLSFVPVLSGGVGESWEWFAKEESFQSSVGESKALFVDGVERAEQLFTRAFYLAPLLMIGLGVTVRRRSRGERDQLLFFLGWCLALGAATVMQRRFMNSFSVGWSMLLGWGLCAGLAFSRDLLRRHNKGEGFGWVVLTTIFLGVIVIFPVAQSYKPYVGNLVSVMGGKPSLAIFEVQRAQVVREGMAGWLRANTPPTSGWLDADEAPEYAILAPWSGGHVMKYIAHRPVVWDNFGDDVGRENFEAAKSYYGSLSEGDALDRIEELGVRYVVARADHAQRSGSHNPHTMMSRLFAFSGSETIMGSVEGGEPEVHLEALERHRLIYASVPLTSEPGDGDPYFKVFELVPGARLSGRAPRGSRVMVRLSVKPLASARFHYVATTQVGKNERYEFVLPYSNEAFSSVVETGSYYQIGIGRVKGQIHIPEAAVLGGEAISGPHFLGDSR